MQEGLIQVSNLVGDAFAFRNCNVSIELHILAVKGLLLVGLSTLDRASQVRSTQARNNRKWI